MHANTIHEIQEALGTVDPDTLREMVRQLALSHVTICGITSQGEDCPHITGGEMRARIDKLSLTEMAALLTPTVWISTEYHVQPRG